MLAHHVVILNVNEKVRGIVAEIGEGLRHQPPDVVILVQDEELWSRHPHWHPGDEGRCPIHLEAGCPTETEALERVQVERARAAIILADPRQGRMADAHSTLVAVAVERHNPQVHTVMELISSVNRLHLRSTEVNEVVCLGEITEKLIAQSCITPGIQNLLSHLLAAGAGTGQIFLCDVPARLEGKTYREVARTAIRRRAPYFVMGFVRRGGDAADVFVLNPRPGMDPGKDTRLKPGDRLVLIAQERPDLA